MAIDPKTPSTVYTSDFDNGLYKSTDSGLTWQPTGRTWKATWSLAIDPSNPAVLYAGGDDGVSKSKDGGATWTPVNNGLIGVWVINVLVDPHRSQTVYATVSESGLYKSTDGGRTWTGSGQGLPPGEVRRLTIDPLHTDTLYAGVNGQLYRSINAGASWNLYSTGLDSTGVNAIAVSSNRVYVATDGGSLYALNAAPLRRDSGYGPIIRASPSLSPKGAAKKVRDGGSMLPPSLTFLAAPLNHQV